MSFPPPTVDETGSFAWQSAPENLSWNVAPEQFDYSAVGYAQPTQKSIFVDFFPVFSLFFVFCFYNVL